MEYCEERSYIVRRPSFTCKGSRGEPDLVPGYILYNKYVVAPRLNGNGYIGKDKHWSLPALPCPLASPQVWQVLWLIL
jgi:hypothetical protein